MTEQTEGQVGEVLPADVQETLRRGSGRRVLEAFGALDERDDR